MITKMNRLFHTCLGLFLLSTIFLSASYNSIQIEIRRTFERPIVIDIKKMEGLNKEGSHVSYKYAVTRVYEGKGMGELGELYERKGKMLTNEEFNEITDKLEQLNLWDIFRAYPVEYAVADGSVWVIEATRGGAAFRFSFITPTGLPEALGLVEYLQMVINVVESPVDFADLH